MTRACGWMITVAVLLAGCGETGTVTDDIGTLWGDESTAEREAREALEARQANKVPMQSVLALEIGRTTDGILLTAFGLAPGPGYSVPALRVRRDGRPSADGYLEFDFVATEPAPGVPPPPDTPPNRQVRADLPIDLRALQGVQGLRVMALQGQSQVNF